MQCLNEQCYKFGHSYREKWAKTGRDYCVYLNIYKLIICVHLVSHSSRTCPFKSSESKNVGNNIMSFLA